MVLWGKGKNIGVSAALFLGLMVVEASAQTVVKARLSAYEVAAVLERSLSDTKLVLHNHGILKEGRYYRDKKAYAVIGKGVGGSGKKQYFDLPEITKKIWRGQYSYYFNDIRSLKPRITASSNGFVATIPFETKGAEMIGRCTTHKLTLKFWDKKSRKVRPCKALTGQKVMPKIQWIKPAIKIAFEPRRYGDSMSFYIKNISVKGDINLGKICRLKVVGKSICRKVQLYVERAKKDVIVLLRAQLSTPAVRHKIAKDIQRRIDRKTGTSILKIKQVNMDKGIIRVALGL